MNIHQVDIDRLADVIWFLKGAYYSEGSLPFNINYETSLNKIILELKQSINLTQEKEDKTESIDKKLEEIKRQGNYSLTLFYGEDIGCDDIDIVQNERNLALYAKPIGYIGEITTKWKGTYKDFIKFDFNINNPVILSNPLGGKIKEPGYYIWGTEEAIKSYKEKLNK
jgi:hypothetical protein